MPSLRFLTHTGLIVAALFLGEPIHAAPPKKADADKPAATGAIYTKLGEAPKLTNTEALALTKQGGSLNASLELASESLGADTSRTRGFGHNTMRKRRFYPRVTLRGFTKNESNVTVKVEWAVDTAPPVRKTETKESGELKSGALLVADFVGYEDEYGVKSAVTGFGFSGGGTTTTYTRTTVKKAEMAEVRVTATTGAGEVLYDGIWKAKK